MDMKQKMPNPIPMLVSRPVNKTAYIVITSDRGLVGGYNASILKTMMEMKAEYHPTGDDFEVICIGSVGADFFRARGFSRFMNCVVCLINLALRKFVRSFRKQSKCIRKACLMSCTSVTTITSTV